MTQPELQVQAGQVVALRLFDLAYETDLKRAQELWGQRSSGASERSRLTGTPPKAVSFGVPPLALELGPVFLDIKGSGVTAAASVRLYDFGIAAMVLRLPIRNEGWSNFSEWVNQTSDAIGLTADTEIWDRLLLGLKEAIGEALARPTATPLQEDYLIAIVHSFNDAITADELLQRADVAPLLAGTNRPLSDGARRDLLKHRFSYYPDDLAVVAWDRAFLYEPRRENDVADVLEIANAQLLEMRVYDELLDAELPRTRALIDAARSRTNLLRAHRYARLARQLHGIVAEVSELGERVGNALQVTEDVYLARVYAAAMELFRVPNVTQAVNRKLTIIRETYIALHNEAAGARAEFLEIAVLALISIEIILSLLRH